MNVTCQAFITCFDENEDLIESAFTSTCWLLFPLLLPFKKWSLKTKEMNKLGCVWFFFYKFSCLIKIALTNSRKVNVAFNYLQKNLNYQFILPNISCVSLKIQWPISQHWPALSEHASILYRATAPHTIVRLNTNALLLLVCLFNFFETEYWNVSYSIIKTIFNLILFGTKSQCPSL